MRKITMRKNKVLTAIACISLLFSFSCKKEYGYDFENGYNTENIDDTINVKLDTSSDKIDYSKYTQARLFPGLMSEEEPRLEDYVVSIDLNYEEIRSSDLRISVAPGNWQSTGVYAPTGELITIEVPAGVYGLTAQIGAHVATGTADIDFPQRDAEIFNRQVLFPGKNKLRNLYGGLIYILPARPVGRIVDLSFTGVAKAPSFKLGETTNEEWHEMVENSTVPWFELESRWICFTLETAKLKDYPIDDPTELMEAWDKSIGEGYWEWTGMKEGDPDIRHRAPFNKWRIVHDVLFKDGVAQVSGYPVRARNNGSYFKQATQLEDVKFLNWGTYHEIGHNMQMGSTWSFNGNEEVTNNLFHFNVSLINGQQSYKIAEVWHKAVPYIEEGKSKSGLNWDAIDNADYGYKSNGHDIRLMMWAQIFERYGYDFMTYIYKRGREARFTSANNQSKVDFFYEALSEFTETDMEPYLNHWGLFPSSVSKKYINEEKAYPILTRDVWNFNPVDGTGGINIIIPQLDKAGWTASANTGENNRNVSNVIDGDFASMWINCFGGNTCHPDSNLKPPASGAFTFEIELDIQEAQTAEGFVWVQRSDQPNYQYKNHVKRVTVEVSTDGVNYDDLGSYDLEYGISTVGKELFIPFHNNGVKETFRYIKFSFERADIDDDVNAAVGEIGLF